MQKDEVLLIKNFDSYAEEDDSDVALCKFTSMLRG